MLESCKLRLRNLVNSPEACIGLFAFLLNWPWEFMQVPFFRDMPTAPHWEAVRSCARATLGDAVIMLMAYWAVAAAARDRYWLLHASGKAQLAGFVTVGVVITVLIERFALAGWWMDGWSYSPRMYLIPVVGRGCGSSSRQPDVPSCRSLRKARKRTSGPADDRMVRMG